MQRAKSKELRAKSKELRAKSKELGVLCPMLYALCSMLFALCFLRPSEGAFRDGFLGAKSVAMGGAYTALADEIDGALVNPAGLSMIKGQQIVATMAALYIGLSDGSSLRQSIVGYAHGQGLRAGWLKPLSLGIVWKRLGAGGLYSENVLAFSFARAFSLRAGLKPAATEGEKDRRRKDLSFGATLNLMNWDSAPTVGADGRVVEDLLGWKGLSFDIGLVIWPSENISVAVALHNVNRPNIASESSKIEEKLPTATRMGVAAIGENVTWAIDMILRDGQLDLRVGLERRAYSGNLLFRAGFSLENLAWGTNFTLGAGYKLNNSVRIDYAFVYPVNTILSTLGSHRVSVVYDF